MVGVVFVQGYNVAPSTLAYFPASMETNTPVCYNNDPTCYSEYYNVQFAVVNSTAPIY